MRMMEAHTTTRLIAHAINRADALYAYDGSTHYNTTDRTCHQQSGCDLQMITQLAR